MTTQPREPEIEALGRLATTALWSLRRVAWLAGAVGVAFGIWRCFWRENGPPTWSPAFWFQMPHATGVVWVCAGLPLLCRVDWLFGRGRWRALGFGVALWFGASAMPEDPEYGWILRFFASLIACLTLLVWRTLWRLTRASARG